MFLVTFEVDNEIIGIHGVYSSYTTAKKVATGCIQSLLNDQDSQDDDALSQICCVYYCPVNQAKKHMLFYTYVDIDNAGRARRWEDKAKVRRVARATKKPSVKMAYDLLNEDPIAMDMLQDMLKL